LWRRHVSAGRERRAARQRSVDDRRRSGVRARAHERASAGDRSHRCGRRDRRRVRPGTQERVTPRPVAGLDTTAGPRERRGVKTLLTRRAGQPGTKRLLREYGANLVCVRYRYDEQRGERIKTVEVVVERVRWRRRVAQ